MSNLDDAKYWQWVSAKRSELGRGLLDLAISSIRPDRRRTYELAAQHEQQQSALAAMKAIYFINSERRERVAWAIAIADPEQCGQVNSGEMGMYFWEKYRDYYLILADAAINALDS